MIQYKHQDYTDDGHLRTWLLDNTDGIIHLTAMHVHQKRTDNRVRLVESRCYCRYPDRDRYFGLLGPDKEPEVPREIQKAAVEHFRKQIQFKPIKDR